MTRCMTRCLIGLLILLPLLTGSAHAGGGESRHSIVRCDPAQTASLKTKANHLTERLTLLRTEMPRYTLAFVRDRYVLPMGRKWVEDSEANRNYERYLRSMSRVISAMEKDAQNGLAIECTSAITDQRCREGETLAYVLFILNVPIKKLYICSGFFSQSEERQLSSLMHELSHLSASTQDLGLSWMEGARSNINPAPTDAYHIEQFATGDIGQELRRQIWFWNWPKPPKRPSP